MCVFVADIWHFFTYKGLWIWSYKPHFGYLNIKTISKIILGLKYLSKLDVCSSKIVADSSNIIHLGQMGFKSLKIELSH